MMPPSDFLEFVKTFLVLASGDLSVMEGQTFGPLSLNKIFTERTIGYKFPCRVVGWYQFLLYENLFGVL